MAKITLYLNSIDSSNIEVNNNKYTIHKYTNTITIPQTNFIENLLSFIRFLFEKEEKRLKKPTSLLLTLYLQ